MPRSNQILSKLGVRKASNAVPIAFCFPTGKNDVWYSMDASIFEIWIEHWRFGQIKRWYMVCVDAVCIWVILIKYRKKINVVSIFGRSMPNSQFCQFWFSTQRLLRFDPLNTNSIIPAESHRKLSWMHIKPFNRAKLASNSWSSLILNRQCLLSLTELWKTFKSYIISAISAIVYVVKSHLNAVAVFQIHGNTKWIPKWWTIIDGSWMWTKEMVWITMHVFVRSRNTLMRFSLSTVIASSLTNYIVRHQRP